MVALIGFDGAEPLDLLVTFFDGWWCWLLWDSDASGMSTSSFLLSDSSSSRLIVAGFRRGANSVQWVNTSSWNNIYIDRLTSLSRCASRFWRCWSCGFNLLWWLICVLDCGNSSFTIPRRSSTYPSYHKLYLGLSYAVNWTYVQIYMHPSLIFSTLVLPRQEKKSY